MANCKSSALTARGPRGLQLNSVRHKSDQLQFSLKNINTYSRETVMRINKMIAEETNFLR